MRIRVCTGSRLHFGFLTLPEATASKTGDKAANDGSRPQRMWGGAGLMVQNPGIELVAAPAAEWSATGARSERILQIVHRFLQNLPAEQRQTTHRPLHFELHRNIPEHQGLGSGTQLSLAIARALAEWYGLPQKHAVDLAPLVGRGKRSAIGIHGFDRGGFLVEAGKQEKESISPLTARHESPDDWRILLIFPKGSSGLYGGNEKRAFELLHDKLSARLPTEKLCRLVLLEMLPALIAEDLPAFGEALYEFNRVVGIAFQVVQGGIYAHPQASEIVTYLRHEGINGVGQSSWGPGLFAVVGNQEHAAQLQKRVQQMFQLERDDVVITRAMNCRAAIETQSDSP